MARLFFFFSLLIALMGSVSAATGTGITEVIAEKWIEQTGSNWGLVKGKCWKETKNAEIKNAIRASYQLDVIDWLIAGDDKSKEGKYTRLYNTSYQGLTDKLMNSGCRVVGKQQRDQYWTELRFNCEGADALQFDVLIPSDIQEYRNALEHQLLDLIGVASNSCMTNELIPTSSLGHMVYSGLRQTPDVLAIEVVKATLLAWEKAIQESDDAVARQRLLHLVKQLSQLRSTAYQEFSDQLDQYSREALIEAARRRIAIINQRQISADRKLSEIWRYQSIIFLSEPDQTTLRPYLKSPGDNPALQFTINQTAQLLYYSEALARSGKSTDAANIIAHLLLWEIGTEGTGLHMTRPEYDDGSISTPYPIWLALVPPYNELIGLMDAQNGQLNGEQYKTARAFSRDQYVSGIGEQGFWNLFEQVVWK